MSDIFTITYEEARENGIIITMQGTRFQRVISKARKWCKDGCATSTFRGDNVRLFDISNFNNISLKQFYELTRWETGLSVKDISCLVALQKYFNNEPFILADIECDLLYGKRACEAEHELEQMKQRTIQLKKELAESKKECEELKKKIRQYDKQAKAADKLKEQLELFLQNQK